MTSQNLLFLLIQALFAVIGIESMTTYTPTHNDLMLNEK